MAKRTRARGCSIRFSSDVLERPANFGYRLGLLSYDIIISSRFYNLKNVRYMNINCELKVPRSSRKLHWLDAHRSLNQLNRNIIIIIVTVCMTRIMNTLVECCIWIFIFCIHISVVFIEDVLIYSN